VAAFALALVASFSWGVSDFVAGVQARRCSVLWLIAGGTTVALIVALVALVVSGDGMPASAVYAGLAAGVAQWFAAIALYRGLAIGQTSIVAPVSGLAPLVPFTVAAITGDFPGAVAAAGAVLAIVGLGLVGLAGDAQQTQARVSQRHSVLLGAIAALGFGVLFPLMDVASQDSPAGAVVANRVGILVLVAVALCVVRPTFAVRRPDVLLITAFGLCEASGTLCFAYATVTGTLGVVGVLASLYPVVTVVLAMMILKERLQGPHLVGVVAVLGGVGLLAAGSG
jgi:drug/metabolite transporter (DMT)-like permease